MAKEKNSFWDKLFCFTCLLDQPEETPTRLTIQQDEEGKEGCDRYDNRKSNVIGSFIYQYTPRIDQKQPDGQIFKELCVDTRDYTRDSLGLVQHIEILEITETD